MPRNLTVGNAAVDSRELNHWLVGHIQHWMQTNAGVFDANRFGLRNSADIEIKWGVHGKNEARPGGWAPRSRKTAISILVQGSFVIEFRDRATEARHEQVKLSTLGDYVMWQENLEHTWYAEEDSVVLTIRWFSTTGPEEKPEL